MADDLSVECILIPMTWKYQDAQVWLLKNSYDCNQPEHLIHYYKFRQLPRAMFDHFTTRKMENGVMYIMGHKKKNYVPPKQRYEHPTAVYTGPVSRVTGYDSDPSEQGINDYLFRE